MSVSQEVTVVQLSKKEKQALQEKYKAQRQAMWSGKQSASQDAEADQAVTVESSGPTETAGEEANQDDLSVQPKPGSDGQVPTVSAVQNIGDQGETPIAENVREEEQTRGSERVFWEAGQEGSNVLTWKLVLAVIGVAIILIGAGVYLGFLFAS